MGMKQLPMGARIYVAAVVAIGGVLLAVNFPLQNFPHPVWFVALPRSK